MKFLEGIAFGFICMVSMAALVHTGPVYNWTGGSTFAQKAAYVASLAANEDIGNGGTVPFNVLAEVGQRSLNLSNGVFTFDEPGSYRISAVVAGVTENDECALWQWVRNGSVQVGGRAVTGVDSGLFGTDQISQPLAVALLDVVAGDTVELEAIPCNILWEGDITVSSLATWAEIVEQ